EPVFGGPDTSGADERRGRDGPRRGAPVFGCRARAVVVDPPVRRIIWPTATRIIASRFPPVHLYERVSADPAMWEALIAAEALVSPRIRDEVGEIHLVPVEERVSGPGATWVMAPFTYRNPKGSRFSNGSYGVYYAANDLPTAVKETAYHFAQFAADS